MSEHFKVVSIPCKALYKCSTFFTLKSCFCMLHSWHVVDISTDTNIVTNELANKKKQRIFLFSRCLSALCWQMRFLVVYKLVFVFTNYNVFTFLKHSRPIFFLKYAKFICGLPVG